MTESSYMRVPVLQRQVRDFGAIAILALIIATVAFVAVRNHELAARQLELADRAAQSVVRGQQVPPTTVGAVVTRARPSSRYPYLRRREIGNVASGSAGPRSTPEGSAEVVDDSAWRPLGGTAGVAVHDKEFYDAATRFERTGSYRAMMPDASGRAISVRCAVADTATHEDERAAASVEEVVARRVYEAATCPRAAIAITSPAAPAPYPFLVMIGVLGLGAALAAAGALIGRHAGLFGLAAGAVTLAVPTMLWQAWIATAAIVVLGAAITLAKCARVTDRIADAVAKNRTALGFLAPAAAAMFVLVAAPFVIGIVLGFYDHHHGTWTFVGLSNFFEILSGGGRPLEDPLNFWFILGVTVLWTAANVALHVTFGVALALVLSRKWIAGRGLFRMLLILPWAIPNYITALIWRGMFEGEYGAVNSLLRLAGLDDVSWFSSWATAFSANVTTNTWLGFPFMMVVALGALETIPRELYEAASVDGASAWQRFRHITLPSLRPALGPAIALGSIWTFNMFNVIYLVSGGRPGNSTNILVTDAYRWAFERGERYGMAAAYATIIFLILLLWTVFGTRIVRSKEQG
jgi:ABC-type sugar transport system permease subunit